jgi:hypothetical protein
MSQKVRPVSYNEATVLYTGKGHADSTLEALISDINTDVKVALNSLARPEWAKFSTHPFLIGRRGSSAGFSA